MTVRANNESTTSEAHAHVRPVFASHTRAGEGDAVDAMRMALAGLSGHRDAVSRAEDDAFDAVVSAELVACTLGQRRHADRTELRVDLLGKVLHAARTIRRLRWW